MHASRGGRQTYHATRRLGYGSHPYRLTEVPVMTTATALRILHISFPAARAALENLAETGVLRRKTVDRGSTAYIAAEVLDLITYAERPGLRSRSRIAL
jgi:hypothetical protein